MQTRNLSIPDNWDRRGLPAWTYRSKAFLDLEISELFLTHWQLAGHVCDMPDVGDYLTFDLASERALIVRGKDGVVRAFNNMCRHRGSRVVTAESGNCKNALVCPFHGWVYNLDGTLRGPARPKSFPDIDKAEYGLTSMDCEIWHGFVFIRFNKGPQPPIAELMAPFEAEIRHFLTEDALPDPSSWSSLSPVNWKSVRDVDNEGYHVAMAHPALQDLYGSTYYDEPMIDGVNRSYGTYNPHAGRRWSVRHYVNFQEDKTYLPPHLQKAWAYYGIFPNTVISVTPETFQFYQDLPIDTGQTLVRGKVYHHRNESRKTRASRYLAARIDRDTTAEDVQLTIWSNESMKSKAFSGFFLSDLEYGVRTHHDHIRARLPVATLDAEPSEADLSLVNRRMMEVVLVK